MREALSAYFDAPVTERSEGVIADLHRYSNPQFCPMMLSFARN
jgi:hypothetical protein